MKTCSKCEETKALTEFYRHKGGMYGVRSACKVCMRESKVYSKNSNRDYVQKARDAVRQYAKETGQDKCAKCGTAENLEWDHIDPSTKVFKISDYSRGKNALMKEVLKCQRLCKQCHVQKTSEDDIKKGEFTKESDLPKYVYARGGKYQAEVQRNKVKHYIGTFRTREEAHEAALEFIADLES
jgi:5-methylcytosine-specific restriction endonuclease McrA